MAPPKKTFPIPKQEIFVNQAAIEDEAHHAATLLKLDHVNKPGEFKALVQRVFTMYGEKTDEHKMKIKKRQN